MGRAPGRVGRDVAGQAMAGPDGLWRDGTRARAQVGQGKLDGTGHGGTTRGGQGVTGRATRAGRGRTISGRSGTGRAVSGERLGHARTSDAGGAGYEEAWRDEAGGTRRGNRDKARCS